MHSAGHLIMCVGDFNGLVGRFFDGIHGGFYVGRRNFVSNTLIRREVKRKVACRICENDAKNFFLLIKKEH